MPTVTLGGALDPLTLEPAAGRATLDTADLTRHAVCLGMTGSGKTGLVVSLLESVAQTGVPVLAIDPKGDLTNLALVLDPDRPETFAPWVEPPREGTVEAAAAAAAAAWGAGLAAEGVDAAALDRRRQAIEVTVHTPGSTAGVPVDVLSALTTPPEGLDPEGLQEYVTGAVSALLALVGDASDPLVDPRAILLSRILGDAFARGESVPFDVLLPRVVDPPFDVLGYYAVDQVLPREAREALALSLNNVAASPAFRPWLTGVRLDLGAWLAPTADGRTPVRVLTLAHLDDRQRRFFLAMLLHAVVAWTRRLPGTGALRALVCFDEVMGFLPPHPRDPPTKGPILTLMKQARAVGVGVVLCTQNPVDLDYKALSNAGTWFVGRLQTRQDRARVVEGLVAAVGESDAGAIDDLLNRLPKRAFVWRTADRPAARVLRSRQTLCWLRGPLTRREIEQLGQAWAPASPPSDGLLAEPPSLGPDVPVRWLSAAGAEALGLSGSVREAVLYARLRVGDGPVAHRWLRGPEAEAVALEDAWLEKAPPAGVRYRPVVVERISHRVRRAWVDELAAAAGVGRGEVATLGWAVVWIPESA